MPFERKELPLAEYDSDPSAVLTPDHEHFDLHLPSRAVFAFLHDVVDDYALSHGAKVVSYFRSTTKHYPIYVLDYKGQQVCLVQAPAGAPAAVMILDWLIAYGVRNVASAGACGVLEPIDEGAFLVPTRALRDEGTSFHYLPPSRFVDISSEAVRAIESALEQARIPHRQVTTWTTDALFRETKAKITARLAEGCSVVDMEASALAACAQMRGARWGILMYSADTLADLEHYDMRNFGEDSKEIALTICLDAVLRL